MLRFLIFVFSLFAATPSFGAPLSADPLMRLNQPSQTIAFEDERISMIAFYKREAETLDLTILVTDAEGEALRTRIGLRDRQHHTLLLSSSSETEGTTRVQFLRTGNQIEMVVETDQLRTNLASHKVMAHF